VSMFSGFSSSSFVLGAICGVFLATFWFSAGIPIPFSTNIHEEGRTENVLVASENISVSDQSAGDTVIVDSISTSSGVWVAVREMNGREFGNVLGAVHVATPQELIIVPLLRATESGRSYAVELYRNDNNGEYAFGVNSVYIDFETGERVVGFFTTE
jgi:hypothetical protein